MLDVLFAVGGEAVSVAWGRWLFVLGVSVSKTARPQGERGFDGTGGDGVFTPRRDTHAGTRIPFDMFKGTTGT